MQLTITALLAFAKEVLNDKESLQSFNAAMRNAAAGSKTIMYTVCTGRFDHGEYSELSEHNVKFLIVTCQHMGLQPGDTMMVQF